MRLAFHVIALALACSASAAERRASTPAELARAIAAAKPGDTLVMADREWRDASIDFSARGAEARPITLRAQTPGQARLTGRSRLRIAGEHLIVSGLRFERGWIKGQVIEFRSRRMGLAQHCRLTQCAVVDYNPPDKKTDSRWVGVYGRRNRVDHCYFAGKTNQGCTVVVWLSGEPNDHRIDHNHFGPRPYLGWNGAETIRIGTSGRAKTNSRTVVENNYFYDCSGEAEIISCKSCENVFRGNTFARCGGALTLRHGDRNTVEGNFFLGQGWKGAGGVRVIGEDQEVLNNYFCRLGGRNGRAALSIMNGIVNSPPGGYFQVKRALIAFNTFIDCRESLHIGLGAGEKQPLEPEDCVIANNLLVAGKYPLVTASCDLAGLTWQGNIAQARQLGIPPPPGIRFVTDAKLAECPDGLWRPAAGSPALAAAAGDFPQVTHDMDGQPRGERKDVGADQRSTAAVRRRPLTPADVGPDWLPPQDR